MKKLFFLAGVLALACGCRVIDTPKGYLRVDNPRRYLFKAVSADGCAFTVSERDNEGNSSLGNWQKAVK